MKNKILLFIFVIFFALGYILISCHIFGKSCPFRILFGISCPTCGMTRAFVSLIHLDIKSAFYYHPLFFTAPVFLLIFYAVIFNKYMKLAKDLFLITFILLLILYVIRIIFKSPILEFDYKDSILYIILHNIIEII